MDSADSEHLLEVIKSLEATRSAVEYVAETMKSQGTVLDRLRDQMSVLKTQYDSTREMVRKLDVSLHTGNGAPSIQTRLLFIEEEISSLSDDIAAVNDAVKGIVKDERDSKKQRLQIAGSLAAAVVSAAAAITVAVLKL